MRTALALGRQALGTTWPNPAVGCVLVDAEGHVAGHGTTAPGGRPHAELRALDHAGNRLPGGTAYVTLEPCAHDDSTPSCARRLAEAGLKRVVIGIRDPDSRTDGAGVRLLSEASVSVVTGCCEEEARRLHAGYLRRRRDGRPHVTLKVATSLDGKIATSTGVSQWLTGPRAREHGHLLRSRHDAILVGAGTALQDDPLLTCRLPGMAARSPVRIICIGASLPVPSGRLTEDVSGVPLWLLVTRARLAEVAHLERAGATVIEVAPNEVGRPALARSLEALGAQGLTSVLVEGGQTLATELLKSRLVDSIAWYGTDAIVGSDGLGAVGILARSELADTRDFQTVARRQLGPDHVRILERSA